MSRSRSVVSLPAAIDDCLSADIHTYCKRQNGRAAITRGTCISEKFQFFFSNISLLRKQTSPLAAPTPRSHLSRDAHYFFSLSQEEFGRPMASVACSRPRLRINRPIDCRSRITNHDNEICQGTHYLDRFFKSYIAVAERSNREHLPLSLSLSFSSKKSKPV